MESPARTKNKNMSDSENPYQGAADVVYQNPSFEGHASVAPQSHSSSFVQPVPFLHVLTISENQEIMCYGDGQVWVNPYSNVLTSFADPVPSLNIQAANEDLGNNSPCQVN